MSTIGTMSRWQSFVWLWRYDSEAKWYWLRCFIKGYHLREAVADNLRDFGLTSKAGKS